MTTIGMLPLFAPSFADVAMNVGSLTLGILLAAFSALVLSGLFEAAKVVEDPFVAFVLMDGVNFHEEADLLLRQIVAIREEAFGQEALDEPYTPPVSACLTTESGLYKDELDKERATRRAVELRQQEESDSKKAQQQSAVSHRSSVSRRASARIRNPLGQSTTLELINTVPDHSGWSRIQHALHSAKRGSNLNAPTRSYHDSNHDDDNGDDNGW